MSVRSEPRPASLVVSVLYREERRFGEALARVEAAVGPVRQAGGRMPFGWTDYYEREMGSPLFRRFLSAERPVSRDTLPGIKVAMESIEADCSEGGKRTVNLDPGLLTPENFLLATGKNYSHRVYLGKGVYADLVLVFRDGGYHPLSWTYPDYASEEIRSLLRDLRREHMSRAAAGRMTPCG